MSTTIPTSEPTIFVPGDTLSWTIELADYLPGDGWTLNYAFVKSGTAAIVIAGTDNLDGTHLIEMASTDTDDFATGHWQWQAYVTKTGGERHTVRTGTVEVMVDYATQTTGYDARSTAQVQLDAIEALISTKLAGGDVSSYSISTGSGSRSWAGMSLQELQIARDKLKAEVAREKAAERINSGLGGGRKILTRFL